ncbi:MAG: C4-type zinc ribbon domain-containing protein [Flavobacteriaceae bacterium]
MAKKKEVSVEEKLRALYDLQLIDSRIDEIRSTRGELPLEIEDLEDEIAGLNKRLDSFKTEIEDLNTAIAGKKLAIDESNGLMKKYTEQQKNIRNNREFDSLSKEVEFQELEIQLAEKNIREFKAKIAHKDEVIEGSSEKMTGLEDHLKHKKNELSEIMKETEKEEKVLNKKSVEFGKLIEERLLKAYTRIRTSVRNGRAVVAVERGAASGSYFTIPPQRQMEIAMRKKIITDEHSGRILVDIELANEEKKKMDKFIG